MVPYFESGYSISLPFCNHLHEIPRTLHLLSLDIQVLGHMNGELLYPSLKMHKKAAYKCAVVWFAHQIVRKCTMNYEQDFNVHHTFHEGEWVLK